MDINQIEARRRELTTELAQLDAQQAVASGKISELCSLLGLSVAPATVAEIDGMISEAEAEVKRWEEALAARRQEAEERERKYRELSGTVQSSPAVSVGVSTSGPTVATNHQSIPHAAVFPTSENF